MIGKRVRFAPNPRMPERKVEGVVQRWRRSPNATTNAPSGWYDVMGDDGVERSVRPSRCEELP